MMIVPGALMASSPGNVRIKQLVMRKKNKKAVSLVEVLTAALILIIAVGGISSVFITVRRYILRANQRSVATSLSSGHSRLLPAAVRADTWGTGDLAAGSTGNLPMAGEDWSSIDDRDYRNTSGNATSRWEVTAVAGRDYRQVDIIVGYPAD